MIYLTNFTNHTNYNLSKNNLSNPNISVCLEEKDVHYNPYINLYNGHDYVEIGGLKWATMNVGANNITDYGLYFQWGDTQGYIASQVGSGEGQKYFGWADYKYSNNGGSTPADMTKYNSTDGKTVLEASDDVVQANWGGSWRMPTEADFQALFDSTTNTWTSITVDNVTVNGRQFTDKTDTTKVLFFPAGGSCIDGSVYGVGISGYYWAGLLNTSNVTYGHYLSFLSGTCNMGVYFRRAGFVARGVVD